MGKDNTVLEKTLRKISMASFIACLLAVLVTIIYLVLSNKQSTFHEAMLVFWVIMAFLSLKLGKTTTKRGEIH